MRRLQAPVRIHKWSVQRQTVSAPTEYASAVYAQDMPQRLPAHLVAKRVLGQLLSAVVMSLRAMLVSLIWLALVPYLTVITWRTYFWFGDVMYVLPSNARLFVANFASTARGG